MKKNLLFICALLSLGLFCASPVLAATSSDAGATVSLDNPLNTNTTDPAQIIGLVIKSVLGIVGGAALVMVVWGGFQWLTSAGNPEKVKKGSSTMIWSVIGLILVLGSYLLVQNVLNFITGT
ncbi:MAG: pilin [Patescibacteria group bacterium]